MGKVKDDDSDAIVQVIGVHSEDVHDGPHSGGCTTCGPRRC